MKTNQLIKRVQQLEEELANSQSDREELSKSLNELNECYTIKISLMQETIKGYEARCQELLEWKKQYIDKQLEGMNKYEQENKKLIGIIDELYGKFEEERSQLLKQSQRKDEEILKLNQEKEDLLTKSQQNEQKVQELLKDHMKQIQLLKTELVQLKEECYPSMSQYTENFNGEIVQESNEEKEEDCSENILKQIKANNYVQGNGQIVETRVKIVSPQKIQLNERIYEENNENVV